ncbi:MAG: cell division protein FtsQ/DivIB [Bdellovibrionales bacterium]
MQWLSSLNFRKISRYLLLPVVVTAVAMTLRSPLFSLTDIDVKENTTGEPSLLFQEVLPQVNSHLNSSIGRNLWSVDVQKLAEELKKIPGVKTVSMDRIPPGTLRAKIETEKIILNVVSNQGGLYPVTESARILSRMKVAANEDVPVIRNKKIIQNAVLRGKAVSLISQLPREGLMSQTSVAEIDVDSKNSFWLSLISPDTKIKISDDAVPVKAARVEKVLEYLQKNKMQARVIDVEFSKKVVVKLRKDH